MNKPICLCFIINLLVCFSALAQKQLKGKVSDANGKPVDACIINIKDQEDNIVNYTRTNDKGAFTLTLPKEEAGLKLEAKILGYATETLDISAQKDSYNFILKEKEMELKTVEIKNRPSLSYNGDTLNYRVSDFSDKQDRSIGDVLKKMPGVTVEENGKISYNGKDVKNLYIDGDNLLNDKYGIGTKSIPHGAVDKVQVIENDQPIKMLQKNNNSDDVAINLQIKDDAKLKMMGDIKAGLGLPEKFDGSFNGMLFKKDTKFVNSIKGNNAGIDASSELTSFGFAANPKPSAFLSAGSVGVPTLPANRTLFNNLGIANLNNLFKFNKDLQLRANMHYLYDKQSMAYNRFSETYLGNQTISYQETQYNTLQPQRLKGQFTLNQNKENTYLNNALTAEYNPIKTISNVVINQIAANQVLRQEMFDFSNDLNYRFKISKNNTLNLYSFIDKSAQPENLGISPGINADILNNNQPYAGLNQKVNIPAFYTNNYAAISFAKGQFTHSYKLGLNYQNQTLNSNLIKNLDGSTQTEVDQSMKNDLNWNKLNYYAESSVEYSTGRTKANLALPLSWIDINYKDDLQNVNSGLEKLIFNPVFRLQQKVGRENEFNINYAFRNNVGNITDVYHGTILKNYRSFFSNNAPLSESNVHNFGGSFNYKKAVKMFFANLGANYSIINNNTISSYQLTNNTQERIVLPLKNTVRSLNTTAGISKYLFDISTTVNLNASYSNSSFNQLQNNVLLPYSSNNYQYKFGFESRFIKSLSITYEGLFNQSFNTAKQTQVKTSFNQFKQNAGVRYSIKDISFFLNTDYLLTYQKDQPNLSYVFADFSVRYRIAKIKTDIDFVVNNLFNVKKFEAIYVSANNYSNGSYNIPGRIGLLKATFNY
ncbi:carboxypeptidase regulatory-like domain-containing protein [Pedobacter montanisoli]|uniref:Carboxypeptidase regulatory-like domain-containing protein n=1 Tax=Pedobacter montanisoli TaxID=2923277 RepID=A0ABS9ZXU5_9SPHI|nr:carboxypeptidase-like regulatory domain-containing protein [Pedobacter montanisoli]MCJ0743107.1 carboxypeptidase regulatory-like domain-containing protein [Pedobacter montanisoli]